MGDFCRYTDVSTPNGDGTGKTDVLDADTLVQHAALHFSTPNSTRRVDFF
jgi:hypothetical protein